MSRSDEYHSQADSSCFSHHGSSVQVMPLSAQGPEWHQVSETPHWACVGVRNQFCVLNHRDLGLIFFPEHNPLYLDWQYAYNPIQSYDSVPLWREREALRGHTGKGRWGTLGWHVKISGEQWRGRPRHSVGPHSFVLAQACELIRKLGYFREVMVKRPLYAPEDNRPRSAVCHVPKAID